MELCCDNRQHALSLASSTHRRRAAAAARLLHPVSCREEEEQAYRQTVFFRLWAGSEKRGTYTLGRQNLAMPGGKGAQTVPVLHCSDVCLYSLAFSHSSFVWAFLILFLKRLFTIGKFWEGDTVDSIHSHEKHFTTHTKTWLPPGISPLFLLWGQGRQGAGRQGLTHASAALSLKQAL